MADLVKLAAEEAAFLARYGGVALGLRLLTQATEVVDGLQAPHWVALGLEGLQAGVLPASESRRLAMLEGRYVALKFSGERESFSPYASRGANSSTRGPGPFVSERRNTLSIAAAAAKAAPYGTRAIVLQEMVVSRPPLNDVTVHAAEGRIVIEARDDTNVGLFEKTYTHSWRETQSGAATSPALDDQFDTLTIIHQSLVALLGFSVNTEGFWKDGHFVAIQLRPVPSDLPSDPSLSAKIWEMANQRNTYITHFVHGTYDVHGVVVRNPTGLNGPLGLFTEPPNLAAPSDIARFISARDLRSIEARWPVGNAIWLSTTNIACQATGRMFIALDATNAFHLSHDIRYLPPSGILREHLRYAAYSPIADALINGTEIIAVSDGNYAAIRAVG